MFKTGISKGRRLAPDIDKIIVRSTRLDSADQYWFFSSSGNVLVFLIFRVPDIDGKRCSEGFRLSILEINAYAVNFPSRHISCRIHRLTIQSVDGKGDFA